MAKSNRATRKELETIISEMIGELSHLKQAVMAIDNYLGAYVKFKGDTITFNDYITKAIEKGQDKAKTPEPKEKDIKSAKKSRYSKVSTPPL